MRHNNKPSKSFFINFIGTFKRHIDEAKILHKTRKLIDRIGELEINVKTMQNINRSILMENEALHEIVGEKHIGDGAKFYTKALPAIMNRYTSMYMKLNKECEIYSINPFLVDVIRVRYMQPGKTLQLEEDKSVLIKVDMDFLNSSSKTHMASASKEFNIPPDEVLVDENYIRSINDASIIAAVKKYFMDYRILCYNSNSATNDPGMNKEIIRPETLNVTVER